MLNFLRTLFDRQPTAGPAPDPRQAAVGQPAPAVPSECSFICREPVLDRRERIAGYEFLLEDRLHARLSGKGAGVRRAYDDALICNLGSSGVDTLLGNRLAFIGISAQSLDNHQLESLPGGKTVLLIDPLDNAGLAEEWLLQRMFAAKQRGVLIGIQLRPATPMEATLALSDFVQLATPDFNGLEIAEWVRRLRKPGSGAGTVKLIAADIQSSDDFQICFRAGFDYFHGPFVDRRENWHPPKSKVDRGRIAQVLHQLRSGVDNAALASTIRQDPVVTYKLLRYINSPANGLASEITTIEQCLMLLGRERFYRWLSLLLFDVQNPGYTERILTEQALVRASLMERIGRRTRQPDANPDLLFLTGLFSLLDQMLDRPLAEILSSVLVPPEVSAALLDGAGPLAPYLQLAIACERQIEQEIAGCAAACRVDANAVNQDILAALIWANEIGEISE